MASDLEVKENRNLPDSPIIVFGLPDTGLVGVISASHIIENKNMETIGSVESSFYPPMIVIHKGNIMAPTRIYGNGSKIISIISEITLPINGMDKIVNGLINWVESKKPEMVLFLGGIPIPNRIEIDQPKCYAVASNKAASDKIKEFNLEELVEGVMVGPYALMLKACKDKNIPAIALLGESFANYPDPGAAAIVIETVNKVLKIDVEVKTLEERAEDIRIKMRDLMRRTSQQMQETEKSREYELPPLYI